MKSRLKTIKQDWCNYIVPKEALPKSAILPWSATTVEEAEDGEGDCEYVPKATRSHNAGMRQMNRCVQVNKCEQTARH
jgi:hypothetical protein